MQFLEGIVREHGGIHLLGDLQDECISSSDGPGGWRDQFAGQQRGFVLGSFGLIDAVGERRIDDDGDGVDLVFLHEGGHGVIELFETGGGAALGGDVGAIDDHMGSDHWGWGSLPLRTAGWLRRRAESLAS